MAITPTGAIFKSLEFDGVDSRDFGVYITGDAVYNAPERAVEMVFIPGRNGGLALDQGRFENVEVIYPAGIFAETETDFREAISAFRNELCSRVGYARLSDEYHPDEYRLAVYRSGLELEPVNYNHAGEFDIIFDCKPQRFLTSGEVVTELTADDTITNPTLFPARPLITVTGNGTLTVNGVSMVIGGSSNTVIDSEVMECYDGSINKNGVVIMTPNEFPVLSPGANTIELTAGITKVEIIPRWWKI